ncbi:MAG: hypothetical protein M3O28_13220, partial [Actinomycetota bacterium]|nr:hypothetical protein [Actinomycetota bacterium]
MSGPVVSVGAAAAGYCPDDRDDLDDPDDRIEVGAMPYVPSVLDAQVAPDDVAAWAARMTPGSAVVTPLAGVDPRRLSAAGRVDALVALEKQLAWLHAAQHRLLAVMVAAAPDQSVDGLDKDWLREEVAAALRLSGVTASGRLQLARELDRLPAT